MRYGIPAFGWYWAVTFHGGVDSLWCGKCSTSKEKTWYSEGIRKAAATAHQCEQRARKRPELQAAICHTRVGSRRGQTLSVAPNRRAAKCGHPATLAELLRHSDGAHGEPSVVRYLTHDIAPHHDARWGRQSASDSRMASMPTRFRPPTEVTRRSHIGGTMKKPHGEHARCVGSFSTHGF